MTTPEVPVATVTITPEAPTETAIPTISHGEVMLRAVLDETAAKTLAALPAAQRDAVLAIAGTDSAAQMRAVNALRPTWAAQAKAVDTAPPANAPAQHGTSETSHRSVYETLYKTDPFAAARYGLMHQTSVYSK